MKIVHHCLKVKTNPTRLHEVTQDIVQWLKSQSIKNGILHLLIQHTSCSLLIQENADPTVQKDIEKFFRRLVPFGDPLFEHTLEGPDDMPAHIRSMLTQTHLSIPIIDGRLCLGTWQGIYLYEHRMQSHHRSIIVQAIGNTNE